MNVEEVLGKSEFSPLLRMKSKTAILTARLPNGYEVVGTAHLVNSDNYDEGMAMEVCYDEIRSKVEKLLVFQSHGPIEA